MLAGAQAGVIDIDGVLSAAADAKVSALDRGLLHGDSAFEVLRTYGGRAFCQREHLLRLQRSCQGLRIPLPVTLEVIAERIARACERSGLSEHYVRVMVTRGVGPLGIRLPTEPRPSVLVYALPLEVPPASQYDEGIEVGLVQVGRGTDGTSAVGAKTGNYLTSVLAVDEVRQRGCAEAIVVGTQGELIEGAASNLFLVRGQGAAAVLETPPVSSGLLAGITRATVIEIATKLGIPVREQRMTAVDLYSADEAFITNSIRELVPVVRADSVAIGQAKPGPVVARLLAAYRQLAHAPASA